jgi:hypothetical protein
VPLVDVSEILFQSVVWIKRCPIFDAEAIVFAVILDMKMGWGVFVGAYGHSQPADAVDYLFIEAAKLLPLIKDDRSLIQAGLQL